MSLHVETETRRSRLRWLRVKLALMRFEALRRKAGFNSDQPRVPAGNPDGGQWTSGDGAAGGGRDITEFSAARRDRAMGHHYVHRSLYEKLPLPPETRQVREDANTGRLYDSRSNKYDGPHRIYNEAVKEHFERFIESNKIQLEKMTPDQARQFVKDVQGSRDPRIRNYNMRIWLREILRRLPVPPRGSE
jgi:hypothetical protein